MEREQFESCLWNPFGDQVLELAARHAVDGPMMREDGPIYELRIRMGQRTFQRVLAVLAKEGEMTYPALAAKAGISAEHCRRLLKVAEGAERVVSREVEGDNRRRTWRVIGGRHALPRP